MGKLAVVMLVRQYAQAGETGAEGRAGRYYK